MSRMSWNRLAYASALALLTAMMWSLPAIAQDTGTLVGYVSDADEESPLPGATVQLVETGEGQATNEDGRFAFGQVEAGSYNLRVSFVGYQSQTVSVDVIAGQETIVYVDMEPSRTDLPDVVVTGTFRARAASEVYRPTSVLTGEALRERLQSSVPATLERVPGFSMESFGPGAARPNIRGMGGDRVLMLEDGQRTGDLYATASDHGVMVEPLSATRMEVIRGPATLLHGPNALGGVANVIRNDIPREQPDRITGNVSAQAESVNNGWAGGGTVEAPLGPLAVRAEFTRRGADDIQTPQGPLERTDMNVLNYSVGASWVNDWGLVGASYRYYDNVYGIPGEFNGELIPGGHAGGVDIEVRRHVGRFRALYDAPLWIFDGIEFDANVTRYIHDEIEVRRDEGREDFFGARFDQYVGEANLLLHHEHTPGQLRAEGAFGMTLRGVAIDAFGNSPGMRSGYEQEAALYGYEELSINALRVQLGLRYDHRRTEPDDKSTIRQFTREQRAERLPPFEKPVSARTFNGLSGSLATLYDVHEDWTIGLGLSRSFRSPHLQELYSDGPHLADFSFDIGEPSLDPEYGYGAELFVRSLQDRFEVEVTGYVNHVQNYTFYENTGQTVLVDRRGDLERITPVFEAVGTDARFLGVESRVEWEALPNFTIDATATYTRASRIEDGDDPLPYIPPLNGEIDLRYDHDSVFATIGLEAAAAQNRVPNPVPIPGTDQQATPQSTTDGYGLLNASIGYRFGVQNTRHTLTLNGHNLTDSTWRNHLSRTKEVAPEPGRNLRLTYRVGF